MMDDHKKRVLQDSAKEIYDSIIIPPELEDVVKKSIASVDKDVIDMQYKKSNSTISVIMKYFGGAAAIIFLSIFIGLNSSETFAREMGEVPILGTVARVFTVRKYTVEKEELTIEKIPETEIVVETQVPEEAPVTVSGNEAEEENEQVPADTVSDNDVSGNSSDNETKMTISGNDIVAVNGEEKKVVDTLTPSINPVTVSGNAVYAQALYVSDFSVDINKKIESFVQKYVSDETTVSYEVKYQKGAIVSFVITSVQKEDNTKQQKEYYNLDLLNGKNVVLSDLLGNNYVDVANVQIVRQMKERVKTNADYVYWGITDEGASQGFDGFTSVNEETDFYINAAGNVVIVFDKYEIAPGFMGNQEFEILVTWDMTED